VHKVNLNEMTWQEVQALIGAHPSIIVLPVGATEQHGHHLPLGTDSIMVEQICLQAAARLEGVVVAPTIAYGTSPNHVDFPGTASISLDTLKALIMDVGQSLLAAGFDMMVIVNGHGGNTAATAAAAHDLRLASNKVVGELMWTAMVKEAWQGLESKIVWHADEQETSLMLALAPELVQQDKAVDELPPSVPFFQFTEEALLNTKVNLGLPRTQALSRSGTIGEARLARAEKGRPILEEAVANLAATLAKLRESATELTAKLTR
jgi:creatinine amidohydrolase